MSLNIKNADGSLTKVAGKTLQYPVNNITTSDSLQDAPVGHILSYMGNTAPAHYLICDGAEYNIADYLDLANHFKKEFGSINYFGGDGTSTFKVPDLRGEFLRGTGDNSHAKQGNGAAVGIHQDGTTHSRVASYNNLLYSFVTGISNYPNNLDSIYEVAEKAKSVSINAGSQNSEPALYTSRPTNTSVLYCIKYEPTYFMSIQEPDYSLDEVATGRRWIDGKMIYRKVVVKYLTPANDSSFVHDIENIDAVVNVDGVLITSSFESIPVNQTFDTKGWKNNIYLVDRTKVRYSLYSYSGNLHLVLEYTKTNE